MTLLRCQDVFAPGSFPTHTYVERRDLGTEERLADALETPGTIVALSGPSKSGKTVLVERVVSEENLITVTGAGIKSEDDVWQKALDWMGEPTQITASNTKSTKNQISGFAEGKVSVPLLGEGGVKGGGSHARSKSEATGLAYGRSGMAQIVREIGGSSFVLLIDDFHYIDRGLQVAVAESLKEAVRQKVKIAVAAVPHRSDDVLRALSDLRGRVTTLSVPYWDVSSLVKIGMAGFSMMNLDIDSTDVERFAAEAAGSPQLMQAICLAACRELDCRQQLAKPRKVVLSPDVRRKIFERAGATSDYRTLVDILIAGAKRRGTERLVFEFVDGTAGDSYSCVLRAIAANPARQSLKYDEINRRIGSFCREAVPVGSSVSSSCKQMGILARNHLPEHRVLEWDEEKGVLDIVDPYLLFYLRWSGHL